MKNYLVIGLGKFGRSIAKTLYDNGNVVLAIDNDEEKVQKILDEGIVEDAITLDVTDENALKNIVKDSFDAAFVCIGTNIQDSILVTLMLKEMNIKNIICKAETKIQGKVLAKVGATKIVYPEELVGEKIAFSIMRPTILEHFKFSDEYSIVEIKVPKFFIGKSLIELNLRHNFATNVIAIKTGGIFNITPSPNYRFLKTDTVVLMGKIDSIGEIIK